MERIVVSVCIGITCGILGSLLTSLFALPIKKLDKLRYKRKLKANIGWFGEDIPELELELGRRYIIQLDDGEDIWELKAKTKAVKQKRKEN